MIRSIRHKGLRRLVETGDRSRLSADMIARLEEVLTILDGAQSLDDLAVPSLRFHALKGDLKGMFAVTVRANWRLIFRFENTDVHDLDLVDYH